MKRNGYINRNIKIVSNKHVILALKLRKMLQLNEVYFVISNQSYQIDMFKIALYPYRKLKIKDNFNANDIDLTSYFENQDMLNYEIKNELGDFNDINKNVRAYLLDKGIFDNEIIKYNVSEKRYRHCLSVANLSRLFALTNNIDEKIAYQAGLLHDIAKKMNNEELNYYMSFNANDFEINQPLPVLHQYVGEKYLKRHYKLKNKKILHAIKHHCLGDGNSKLAKIIYCADKLDPARDYDSTKEIDICLKDINRGYDIVVDLTKKYLESKGEIS